MPYSAFIVFCAHCPSGAELNLAHLYYNQGDSYSLSLILTPSHVPINTICKHNVDAAHVVVYDNKKNMEYI